jgi:hypothetical protein
MSLTLFYWKKKKVLLDIFIYLESSVVNKTNILIYRTCFHYLFLINMENNADNNFILGCYNFDKKIIWFNIRSSSKTFLIKAFVFMSF